MAEALVAREFEELKPLMPKRPVRSALGLRPRDKYWLHMFDALGLAHAVHQFHPSAQLSRVPDLRHDG